MVQELAPFEVLARRIDPRGRLVRSWELKGGVSAQVTAFEVERADGRAEKLVVRRHGARDLKRNPQIAADEFRLLQLLAAAGLPAPAPRFLDARGEIFSTPCLVLAYVDGERPSHVDESKLVTELADVLSEIHRVGITADVSFLRQRELGDVTVRGSAAEERRIQEVLDAALPLSDRNRPVLLHGDFWPGNTLWKAGRLVAVIDWEDAAVGDPLADVANARLELVWALGFDAMEAFTSRYEANVPGVDFTDLPYWDLWADLRLAGRIAEWGLDAALEEEMRAGHEAFVEQALAKL